MRVFSTSSLPTVREKLAYFNDTCAEIFTPLEARPSREDFFDNEVRSAAVGGLTVSEARCTPFSIARRMPGSRGPDEPSRYFLHLQLEGALFAEQAGRQAHVAPGQMVLCASTAPYSLSFPEANATLVLTIPAAELAGRVPAPERFVGQALSAREGPFQLTAALFAALWRYAQEAGDDLGEIGQRLAGNLLDVFATSCAAGWGELDGGSSVANAWRERIKRRIEAELSNPDLSVAALAAGLGISGRYARMLFAAEDEAISEYILRRRLERSAALLGDRLWRGRTVTEIAFANGFNNASHFARAFKARYGVTPKDYRAAGRPV